jgi:hypothetical protein
MAQDSIAYGESLLADIRQRNDKLRNQARKRAKRDEWKGVAMGIGLEMANDIFADRQQKILMNEEAVKQKMSITSANDSAQKIITDMNNAKAYEFGEADYYKNQFGKLVDNDLSEKYLPNQRNELQYESLKQQIIKDNFDTYYKEIKAREQATQDYIAKKSVEQYNSNMDKIAGDGTLRGAIKNTITNLTGNLNVDAYNQKNATLAGESAQYVEAYVNTFNKTQDSLLAEAIADLAPNAAGVPAPKVGEGYDVRVFDILGNETNTKVFPTVVSDRDKEGNLVQRTIGMVLGERGYEPFTNKKQDDAFNINQIGGGLTPQEIDYGKIMFEKMPAQQITKLNGIWAKQIELQTDGKIKPNDMGYNNFYAAKRDSFIRTLVAAGKQAAAQGWGTIESGQKVYIQAVMNKLEGAGGVTAIGHANIFDTLFAMNDLTTGQQGKQGLVNGKAGMRELANDYTKMYQDLEGMSTSQRGLLFNRLKNPVEEEGVNYFEGNLNSEKFGVAIEGLENIFNKQQVYNFDNFKSIDDMLAASLKEIESRSPEEINALDVEKRRQKRLNRIKNLPLMPTL